MAEKRCQEQPPGPSVYVETIPLCFKNVDGGYYLSIKVDKDTYVDLHPPGCVGLLWSYDYRHLLDVVVQYCTAVLQFMKFAFPSGWDPEAGWAAYTRDFIQGTPLSPPPAAGTLEARYAFCVWAVLTRSFFCGLNPAADLIPAAEMTLLDEEQAKATRWLHRLVGESGLRTEGPVYQAMASWVKSMSQRLDKFAADSHPAAAPGGSAAGPSTSAGGAAAVQEPVMGLLLMPHCHRAGSFENEGGFYPIYPYLVTGGFKENRLKISGGPVPSETSEALARYRPVIRGSCGVPKECSANDNCAVAYMVASSVVQTFYQADKAALEKLTLNERKEVTATMVKTVLKSDEKVLDVTHARWRYPRGLRACMRGWKLALEKIPQLVKDAEGLLAAAGLVKLSGLLLMPKQMPPLSNTQRCLRELNVRPEAMQPLFLALCQTLRGPDADPVLKEVGRLLLEQTPQQPRIQSQRTVSQPVQQTQPPQQVPLPSPPPHPSPSSDVRLVGEQDQPRPRKRQRRRKALAAPGAAGAAPAGAGTGFSAELDVAIEAGRVDTTGMRCWLGSSSSSPSAAGGAVATHGNWPSSAAGGAVATHGNWLPSVDGGAVAMHGNWPPSAAGGAVTTHGNWLPSVDGGAVATHGNWSPSAAGGAVATHGNGSPSAAGGAVATHGNCTFGLPVSAAVPDRQMGQLLAAGAPVAAAGAADPQVVGTLPAETPAVVGGAGGLCYLPELAAPAAAQVLSPPQQPSGSAGGAPWDLVMDAVGGGVNEEDEYMDSRSRDMKRMLFDLLSAD